MKFIPILLAIVTLCFLSGCLSFTEPETKVVSAPIYSPQGGICYPGQLITLSSLTPGADIYYTTDGSEPSILSTRYVNPITFTQTATYKAKAIKSGMKSSVTMCSLFSTPPQTMVFVQGGLFNNGVSDVTVSSFYLDKYELTEAMYHAIMGFETPHYSEYYDELLGDGPEPSVTWYDAIEYCNRRSMKEDMTPCYSFDTFGTNPDTWPEYWNLSENYASVFCDWSADGYRLPSEAEWEFAARGGNLTHNYSYSGSALIDQVAWYYENAFYSLHSVGTLAANELGIFDMSGNASEWCWDTWGDYPTGALVDPHGPDNGAYKVIRGGDINDEDQACRVSSRTGLMVTYRSYCQGFRVCRNAN